MRRAVAIDSIRAYLEQQIAAIEPAFEAEQSKVEPGPDWPAIWTRYAWLYWLERKALARVERAGVGAVLAPDPDDRLLEQLGLLGEQLHAQGRYDVVPRELTQDAVAPYWASPTAISASAEGWRRRCRAQDTER